MEDSRIQGEAAFTDCRLPSFEKIPSFRHMGRVFLAAFLGAIVCFIWGAVSWMVLDWHSSTLRNFDNEELVSKTMSASVRDHGVYMLPYWMGPSAGGTGPEARLAQQKAKADMQSGPYVFAVVRPGAKEDMFGMDLSFAWAFLRSLGACFIVALLVRQTKRLDYIQKVGFCALCGIFAGLVSDAPMLIWFEMPLRYTLVNFADHLCEWFLAGLVIGAIVHEKEFY